MSGASLAPRSRRAAGVGLLVLGNNLPDADFLYPYMTGSRLDYLLQHRGYTHTIAGALLISALMLLALWLWFRIRHRTWSSGDVIYLALLALLAPLLHIAMDYTNSYGVHPFWPLNNAWFYGDAVFIVEPLLWACATPLLFTLRSLPGRTAIGLALLAGVSLCAASGLVPIPLIVTLVAVILLLGVIGRLASARTALAAGIATWLGLTALFFQTSSSADARIATLAARAFPDARTLDRVLTPLPANPICREVFIVQTEADRYVVRKAMHSIMPRWIPATACPSRAAAVDTTAQLSATTARNSDEVAWLGEISMPRGELAGLAAQFCAVRAMLRFARTPWVTADEAGWIAGDLRYDREPELGFAEIRVAPGDDECPAVMPGWLPPRRDVLGDHD